jgi:hypothetical protein
MSDNTEHDGTKEINEFSMVYDEEEMADDQPRSILFGIIKQLSSGMDLTRISLPACISDSRSFIELCANLFSHIDLLLDAIKVEDPVLRLTYITRFYLSGFHIRPKGVKKPYNPILFIFHLLFSKFIIFNYGDIMVHIPIGEKYSDVYGETKLTGV